VPFDVRPGELDQAGPAVAVAEYPGARTEGRRGTARPNRSAAYRVLRERDIWTRVLTDLELYNDENDDLRNRVRGDIAGWLSREAATAYSMPAGATADRLDDLLGSLAGALGAHRERLLRFHLGLTSTRTTTQ
jgi:hypothetical protein